MTTGKAKYQSPMYQTGLSQLPRMRCAHLSQQVLPGRIVTLRVCTSCRKVLDKEWH